jgi:LysM repeat protein
MKKSYITKGLAGILLMGSLSLNSMAQNRNYIQGNVNNVKYELTTEKDFPKYKIEEQCLFNKCYTFWDYTPKKGELNFWVSNKDEESMNFQEGKQVEINAPQYIPTKIGEKINVTNLNIERTSYEKLKKRAKKSQHFGFSVDINDKDLKFKIPEIDIKGKHYIVLKEIIDNSKERTDASFYLIPKTKGTVISFPNKSFIEEHGYEVQAQITCNEEGGVYQPILKEDCNKFNSYVSEDSPSGIVNQKKDIIKQIDSTKYKKENALEKQIQTGTKDRISKDENFTYTIKSRDTFYNIADKFYGTGKDAYWIQKSNPSVNPSNLKVGQKIIIPCK